MNKKEQTATMYETIPAVAELNKVPGFNPLKLLRRIISPENGEEMMQLDLRYKKLWFRLANPKGRIRLNALRITEQMAIYEAQIFLERTDENPIGSFTSSCTKEEAPGGRYIQAAQQAAMDEALSDAGFGIQFADVSMDAGGSRYGSRIPLNGDLQPQKAEVPASAEIVSEEMVQASSLPVQGGKVAVNAKAEEKEPVAQSLAQNTGTQSGTPLKVMTESGNPAMGLPADSQSGTESLPVNAGNSFGNLQVQSENSGLPVEHQEKVQETTPSAGELPVKTAEPESLPVQTNAETPAQERTGNVLPASGKKDTEEDTRKAVQGMMALLGGQNVSEKTAASSDETFGNTETTETRGQASEVQSLPADGEQAQEKANVRYTPDMPVEEIVKLMTFEEAGQVVVDNGVCKGYTIAEVAERRPPSLKFYLYGGYRGDNNILRAAAQIMLDSLAAKKAGNKGAA